MKKFLLPSFKNLGKLKDFCVISIIFQPPYSNKDIIDITNYLDSLNINYVYKFTTYTFEFGRTPLARMRQDCADLAPALFYALLDDDMAFEPGIDLQYLNLLYHMIINKSISIACLRKIEEYLNMKKPQIFWYGFDEANFSTNAGIIYRGGLYYDFNGLLPEYLVNKVGGKQDISTGVYRILHGDSAIICTNAKMTHYENRKIPGYDEYRWTEFSDENTLINWLKSVGYEHGLKKRYIRTRYKTSLYSEDTTDLLYKKGCIGSNNNYIRFKTYELDFLIEILPKLIKENWDEVCK